MAIPTTVTRRAEGNDFVASTGMLLSGVTGFTLRTGFYLTNSGNHPIETSISTIENFAFTVPSGIETPITTLAGQTTLIPFDFIAAMPNSGPVGTATSTGPDHDGTWRTQLNLRTRSAYDNQQDPDGVIKVYITGQATGRSSVAGTVGAQGALDWADTLPEKPSGFLIKSNYAANGRPQAELRWQHPETGYYVVRYKLESATDIDNDASSATGTWSHEGYFDVNYVDVFIPPNQQGGGYWTAGVSYPLRKYATPTGISQRYTYGTDNNEETPYGEIKLGTRTFDVDYYYRIKSQYFNQESSAEIFESPYIYGYPVAEFKGSLPSDVAAGLESGNTTLPSSSSSNIKVDRQRPLPLQIYFTDGQENINLYDTVTNALSRRSIDKTWLTTGDANYTFSGVHWIVPIGYSVGSTNSSKAAIDTGSQLLNSSTTHQQEITGVLVLQTNSTVVGRGGDGGDGGYVTIDQFNVNTNNQRVSITTPVQSTDGSSGTAAIRISNASIDKFSIRKDNTARILGGGGGGGAGDPLVQPKIFDLNSQKIHQIQFGEGDMMTLTAAGGTKRLGKLGSGLQKTIQKENLPCKLTLLHRGELAVVA